MDECKSISVPLEFGYQVNCNDDCEKVDQHDYQSLRVQDGSTKFGPTC